MQTTMVGRTQKTRRNSTGKVRKAKKEKMYNLVTKNGFISLDIHGEPMIVQNREYADTFTEREADIFCREYWIEARIVEIE